MPSFAPLRVGPAYLFQAQPGAYPPAVPPVDTTQVGTPTGPSLFVVPASVGPFLRFPPRAPAYPSRSEQGDTQIGTMLRAPFGGPPNTVGPFQRFPAAVSWAAPVRLNEVFSRVMLESVPAPTDDATGTSRTFNRSITELLADFPITTVSGLKLWLRTDRGFTLTGGNVSEWFDQSGSGNDFAQSLGDSLNALPVVANALNGYSAFSLGSVGGLRRSLGSLKGGNFMLQPLHFFLVLNAVTWTVNTKFIDATSSDTLTAEQGGGATPTIEMFAGGSALLNTGLTTGSYHILQLAYNHASSFIKVDANAAVTGDIGSAGNQAWGRIGFRATIGAGGNVVGSRVDLVAVIVFNRILTDGGVDQAIVYNALQAQYFGSVPAPIDVVTRVYSSNPQIAESVSAPTDAVARAFAGARSVSDSIVIPTDAEVRAFSGARSISESKAAPTDAIARAFAGARSIGENDSAPTDAVARAFSGARNVLDNVPIPTDAVARAGAFARNVQEDSSFDPTTVAAVSLWLRGDLGITTVNGAVSQWNDQSGNGNNVSQATASHRPAYVTNGLNGHNTVRFTGGDFDVNGSVLRGTLTQGTPMEIWLVVKSIAIISGRVWISNGLPFDGNRIIDDATGPSPGVSILPDGALPIIGPDTSLGVGNFGIIRVQFSNPNSLLQINQDTPTSGAHNVTTFTGDFWLGADPNSGGRNHANIEVADLIVFNAALSSGQQTAVWDGLRKIYFTDDVGAPADAVTRVFSGARSLSESDAAPTDSIVRVFGGFREADESELAPSDAVARAFSGAREADENELAPADAVSRVFAGARSLSESDAAPTDSIVRVFSGSRSPSESIGSLADAVARVFSGSRNINESVLAVFDAVSYLKFGEPVADSIYVVHTLVVVPIVYSRLSAPEVSSEVAAPFVYTRLRRTDQS